MVLRFQVEGLPLNITFNSNFLSGFGIWLFFFLNISFVFQVYSILRHVAEVLEYTKDEQLESLFQRTAWVFDDKYKRPGYGAYDAFKHAVS